MFDENDLAQINNIIGSMVNEGSSMSSYSNSMASLFKQVLILLDEINEIINHFHSSHKHFVENPHISNVFNGLTGTIGGCIINTFFEALGQELETGSDLDYNSLIFGKDFKFDRHDPNLPRFMYQSQKQASIRYPILKYDFIPNDLYKDVPVMSFSDWVKSVNLSVRNSPKAPDKKLILQLLLKENPDNVESNVFDGKVDIDDNNNIVPRPCSHLVYGYDFIIDPEDKDKPQELIDLEKELNLPSDIKKVKY